MSGETTNFKFKFAEAADEVNKFPVNVDEPKTKEIDKVINERTLSIKKHAAGYTAVSGEWGIQEKTAETTTLPAATSNFLVGVYSTVAEAKVTTSGGAFIEGDFITPASKTGTVVLTTGQHVLLLANGTNWQIVAGEPKREQKYAGSKLFTKAEAEAEQEVSATRPAMVTFDAAVASVITIGGVAVQPNEANSPVTYYVPAGQKWKLNNAVNISTILL